MNRDLAFEAKFPVPEGVEWGGTAYRPIDNNPVHWPAAERMNHAMIGWRAALSHAEGEAVGIVEPADHQTAGAYLGDKPRRMAVAETAPGSIQALPEGTKLYTHPAPQVAVPEDRK